MPMPAYPTIIVPGITASYLHDQYVLPPDLIWSVTTREYERASLHPNNLKYEAMEPARIVPGQIFEIAYKELIEELRYNLRTNEDLPVPVFPFSYDWRQPIETTERLLKDFIDEVIERTKLLRHYHREGYANDPKVNLVGHSMGGLIIAGYLQGAGRDHRVHKVVTLATPFQGSFEAVIKITTGTANLGPSPPSSREREAARLTPALYQLLPSFQSGLEDVSSLHPTARHPTLFDPAIWQPSIVDTIKEYVRLHGLDKEKSDEEAPKIFAGLLDAGKKHRDRIDSLRLDKVGLKSNDWLCVVGVDSTTRVRLKVKKIGDVPSFDLSSSDRQNLWAEPDPLTRRLTGDGTVPFEGAIPKFLAEKNLVCVSPDDYGYWELQDRALSAIERVGFHGILPNMDMLHRLIAVHLAGRPDLHGNTWGRPAPGVTKWDPPIAGLRDKSKKQSD